MWKKAKFILITAYICLLALSMGIDAAFAERGYFAFGGEWLIPVLVAVIAYMRYNHSVKKYIEELKNLEE